jgi:hypothetical protein
MALSAKKMMGMRLAGRYDTRIGNVGGYGGLPTSSTPTAVLTVSRKPLNRRWHAQ